MKISKFQHLLGQNGPSIEIRKKKKNIRKLGRPLVEARLFEDATSSLHRKNLRHSLDDSVNARTTEDGF